jgi:large subunit ribosomal protein L16
MKKRFRIKNRKQGGSVFSNYIQYGTICIKSTNYGILTNKQLESFRKCITKKVNSKGVFWIRVRCVFPVTKKSAGSRMGKGAGPLNHHIANIKKGHIILEVTFPLTQELLTFLKKLTLKLPVGARILLRSFY